MSEIRVAKILETHWPHQRWPSWRPGPRSCQLARSSAPCPSPTRRGRRRWARRRWRAASPRPPSTTPAGRWDLDRLRSPRCVLTQSQSSRSCCWSSRKRGPPVFWRRSQRSSPSRKKSVKENYLIQTFFAKKTSIFFRKYN